MALAAVKWAIPSRTILKYLFPIQNGALYCVCHKTTYSSLPDDYNCKVELALTSDGRTIVCYHPSVDIPYEHTKVCIRKSLVIFNLLLDYSPFFTVSKEKGIVWFSLFGLDLLLAFLFYCFDFSLISFHHFSLKVFFSTQSETFKHNYGISFLV